MNVNEEELKEECVGLRIAIAPVVASVGTVTDACVLLITFRTASCPLPTHAWVDPVKPVPVSVTDVPEAPLAGENPVIPCCGLFVAADAPPHADANDNAKQRPPIQMACTLTPTFLGPGPMRADRPIGRAAAWLEGTAKARARGARTSLVFSMACFPKFLRAQIRALIQAANDLVESPSTLRHALCGTPR